jgi:hypothetical protein
LSVGGRVSWVKGRSVGGGVPALDSGGVWTVGRVSLAIPPSAFNPCFSLISLHALYVIVGNRSLTSSILSNFFSRLLLCTGWCNPMYGGNVAKSTSSVTN